MTAVRRGWRASRGSPSPRRARRRAARRGARARDRRGLRGRRRAGDRRARLRHGDDRAGRQDRRPGQPLGDRGEAARLGARRDRPARRAERGGRDRRRERRRRRSAPPTCSPRPSTARTARRSSSTTTRCRRRRGARAARRTAASSASPRSTRRSRAPRTCARAPRAARRRPGRARRRPQRGRRLPRHVGGPRRLRGRGDPRAADRRPRPGAGGLGLEAFLRPVQFVRATRRGARRAARRERRDPGGLEGLPLHGPRCRLAVARRERRPLPRVRAVRLGVDRRGGRRAARAAPGPGDPLRREHAAAARRAAGTARRELRAAERVPRGDVPRAARGGRRAMRGSSRSRSSPVRVRTG